jgi:DNA-binding LytR/AlgR family response regulator
MKLKTVIVDDEPVARKGIREFAGKIDFLDCIGEAKDIDSLLGIIEHNDVDLIFMDIEMPGLSGIDFVKTYQKKLPLIVFVTAYHQFAVESYELHAADYLLKPVSFERFSVAAERALEIAKSRHRKPNNDEAFFVRHEGKYQRLDPKNIVYVSAMQNYIRVHLKSEEQLVLRSTLKDFEQQLSSSKFLLVHKSYLINIECVESLASTHIQLQNAGQIPVGRAFKDQVKKQLLG